MLDERHAGHEGDQDVLLQSAQVDEGAQLAWQVAVVGEGCLLGGVCWEGHGEVAAAQQQLQQVVFPATKKKVEEFKLCF